MFKEEVLFEEPETTVSTLTDYQIERNKPIPNRIHGLLQTEISHQLRSNFGQNFQFIGELSLASKPLSTPDICIYPRKKLNVRTVEAKESEVPLTTIEIVSPSQSPYELQQKAWEVYFPMGVKSAWIVIPELKGIQILLPDDTKLYGYSGKLTDPTNGISIDLDKVFEDLV